MLLITLRISVRIFNMFMLRSLKIFASPVNFISSRVSSSIHSYLLWCWISLSICEFLITFSYSCVKIPIRFWEVSSLDIEAHFLWLLSMDWMYFQIGYNHSCGEASSLSWFCSYLKQWAVSLAKHLHRML